MSEQLVRPNSQIWAPDPGVRELAPRFLGPHSNVLDVGTGSGRNAMYLAGQGHEVTAIDPSWEEVLRAREMARQLGGVALKPYIAQADILGSHPRFKEKNFDGVFATRILHELGDRGEAQTAINAMQRLTVPDGYNFITAYIGTAEDQAKMSHRVILDPGEVEACYTRNDWEIVHSEQTLQELSVFHNKPLCQSYDEVVARKPA